MKRIFWIFIFFTTVGFSQEQEIKNTINLLFEGMHKGDTAMLNKAFHPDLKMQTTFVNKEGKAVLQTSKAQDFIAAVASKKPEDIWLEKVLSYEIHVDANLASVWTPYEFYINGNFSHCGVNSFQLVQIDGTWLITYIIDTRRREACN